MKYLTLHHIPLPSLHVMGRGVGILLLLVLTACRPQLPKGVIGEGKMERILYDYHMMQGVAENTPADTGNMETYRYELMSAVFKKHGVTEEEFEKSMTFYCSDLQRLHRIYRNLGRRFEREASAYGETQVRDVYANLSADGDTANVWGGRPVLVVRSNVEENIMTWKQTCDSTWLPGDQLIWRFKPVSFSPRSYRSITADIVVHFTNDSIRSAFRTGTPGSQLDIQIRNNEGWTPAAIIGHLYLPVSNDPQDLTVIAATQVMLIRMHVEQKVVEEVAAPDSLASDSLAIDSVAKNVTPSDNERRRSPDEFRRQQDVEQKIDIVKEKPYVQPRQQGRRRMQPPHLAPQRRNTRNSR